MGEYVLREKLGEGGFGVVWKAENPDLPGRWVAIKVAKALDGKACLKTEGQAQHELLHPGIVRTLSLNLRHDPPYAVQELVDGKSLRQVLQNNEGVPFELVVRISEELLSAVSFAHSAGIIHGDIAPSNVLLDNSGRVRLTDFGLSYGLASNEDSVGLSGSVGMHDPETLRGTLAYFPPERRRGEPATRQGDVFAVGVLLHELITRDAFSLRFPMDRVPRWFSDVVAKATSRAPDGRFDDAEKMLRSIQNGVAASSRPEKINETSPKAKSASSHGLAFFGSMKAKLRGLTPVFVFPRVSRRTAGLIFLSSAALLVSYFLLREKNGINGPASWDVMRQIDEDLRQRSTQVPIPNVPSRWEDIFDVEQYRAWKKYYNETRAADRETRAADLLSSLAKTRGWAEWKALEEGVPDFDLAQPTPDEWPAVGAMLLPYQAVIRDSKFEQVTKLLEGNKKSRAVSWHRHIQSRAKELHIKRYLVCAWRPLHRRLGEDECFGLWVEILNRGYDSVESLAFALQPAGLPKYARQAEIRYDAGWKPMGPGGEMHGTILLSSLGEKEDFDLAGQELVLEKCVLRDGVKPNVIYVPALSTELDIKLGNTSVYDR